MNALIKRAIGESRYDAEDELTPIPEIEMESSVSPDGTQVYLDNLGEYWLVCAENTLTRVHYDNDADFTVYSDALAAYHELCKEAGVNP